LVFGDLRTIIAGHADKGCQCLEFHYVVVRPGVQTVAKRAKVEGVPIKAFGKIGLQMEKIKIFRALLLGILVVVAGAFFLFYNMYQKDVKALTDFPVAYEYYDKAISNYSAAVINGAPAAQDLAQKADQGLVDLHTKVSTRLSSLIKNDAALMSTMLEIADLAGKEVDTLRAYQAAAASKNTDLDRFVQELHDLTNRRQTAYAHFRELAELKE
jgi:hypothetical protein